MHKYHPIVIEMAEGVKALNPKIEIEYGIIVYSILGDINNGKKV